MPMEAPFLFFIFRGLIGLRIPDASSHDKLGTLRRQAILQMTEHRKLLKNKELRRNSPSSLALESS